MSAANVFSTLLECARRVDEEWCWPATDAISVIQAIELLGLAVLGVELWELRADGVPVVKGWSQYDLPSGPWSDVVQGAARAAADEVLGYSENLDLWVNISWSSEAELKGPRSDG